MRLQRVGCRKEVTNLFRRVVGVLNDAKLLTLRIKLGYHLVSDLDDPSIDNKFSRSRGFVIGDDVGWRVGCVIWLADFHRLDCRAVYDFAVVVYLLVDDKRRITVELRIREMPTG